MLKLLRNKKAQAIFGEYVLVIFIVIGVMTSMSVYFRRVIQARIHDARSYMIRDVKARAGGYYADGEANLYVEYEPYYANTASEIRAVQSDIETLVPGASTGKYTKTYSEIKRAQTISTTAPPKEADKEFP